MPPTQDFRPGLLSAVPPGRSVFPDRFLVLAGWLAVERTSGDKSPHYEHGGTRGPIQGTGRGLFARRVPPPWRPARQQFVQQQPQAIDIGVKSRLDARVPEQLRRQVA